MSKQNKSDEPAIEQAQRKLRLANVFLLGSFALAVALFAVGANPIVALALLIAGVIKAYGLAQESKKTLDDLERQQALRQAALSLGLRLSSEVAEEFSGEVSELRETAGIELLELSGFLGARPVFLFAIKDETVYEYDGLLSAHSYPRSESLVINELIYAPATPERSAWALAQRDKKRAD